MTVDRAPAAGERASPSATSTRAGKAALGPRAFAIVAVATIAVGLVAGLGGVAVTRVLHEIQRYAYRFHDLEEHFVDAAIATDPWRRVVAVLAAGVVAGVGWWLLDRFGRPRVTIEKAVSPDGPPMPVATTIGHALLQIVTVALGSPLGREVAPREIGSALAGWMSRRIGLAAPTVRVLVACGAGAGLAAVYNVPWAGALFTVEALLRSFGWRAVVPALATSLVATAVSRAFLGDVSQYTVPAYDVDASALVWAIVCGPLIGLVAVGFRKLGVAARPKRPGHDARTCVLAIVGFASIAALAWPFPEILGNGKGPAQFAFDGHIAIDRAAWLLVVKMLVVGIAIRVGAYGGLLTPAIACGALFATIVGAAWSLWWPGPAAGVYALIGGTAFLSVSMAMPMTATVLLFELTGMPPGLVVPVVLAVAGATAASRLIAYGGRRREIREAAVAAAGRSEG